MKPFELQGHRGARGLKPENTLPSFEAALDVGVASIETDIHLTADGVPVLFHDASLNERIFETRSPCTSICASFGSSLQNTDPCGSNRA